MDAARKEWEQGIADRADLQMPYEEGRLRLSLGRLAKDTGSSRDGSGSVRVHRGRPLLGFGPVRPQGDLSLYDRPTNRRSLEAAGPAKVIALLAPLTKNGGSFQGRPRS